MSQPSTAPYRIICPGCQKRYPVADRSLFGKNIRCKKCDTSFVAEVVPAEGRSASGNTTTSLPVIRGYWVSRQPGETKGPYSLEKIHEFRDKGLISPDHNLSKDTVKWSKASTFPEVFPPAEEAPEPPPPPTRKPSSSPRLPAKNWWISVEGEKDGPYSAEDIRQATEVGSITADTHVWQKGWPKWTRLADVPELVPSLSMPVPETHTASPDPDGIGSAQDHVSAFGGGSSAHPARATSRAQADSQAKKPEVGQRASTGMLLLVGLVAILVGVGAAFLVGGGVEVRDKAQAQLIYLVLLIVAVMLEIRILWWGISTVCPKCSQWWARFLEQEEELDRNVGYRTVTRFDRNESEHRNRSGRVVGTTGGVTSRQEQIVVTAVKLLLHYSCRFCDHQWTSETTRESEGTI